MQLSRGLVLHLGYLGDLPHLSDPTQRLLQLGVGCNKGVTFLKLSETFYKYLLIIILLIHK